ncbi:hypothetical protein GJ496_001757 [Pomphorhynchus laevis]|nr:hypothetical protein GJ496_001757 [Pomphorhynchus laevis]
MRLLRAPIDYMLCRVHDLIVPVYFNLSRCEHFSGKFRHEADILEDLLMLLFTDWTKPETKAAGLYTRNGLIFACSLYEWKLKSLLILKQDNIQLSLHGLTIFVFDKFCRQDLILDLNTDSIHKSNCINDKDIKSQLIMCSKIVKLHKVGDAQIL